MQYLFPARIVAAVAIVGCLSSTPVRADTHLAFVTCPLLRDTPELPCWMVRHDGKLYYLGIQSGRAFATAFFPPQMKHKVLVEGTPSTGPTICGGVALENLHVSALPEISPECTEMLPNEGYVSPKGRPAGADPALPTGAKAPLRGPQDAAPVLYTDADVAVRRPITFNVLYTFDSDFTQYPLQQNRIIQAQEYAKAIKASQIKVTAYRGATALSNGRTLVESPTIAGKRASNVRAILAAFDIPDRKVVVDVRSSPEATTGSIDYFSRRVQIDVVP